MSGQYYYPQQGQYRAPVRRTKTGAIIAIVVLIVLLLIGLGVVIYFLTKPTGTTTTPSTTSGTTSSTTPSTTSDDTTPSTTSDGTDDTTPSTTSGGTDGTTPSTTSGGTNGDTTTTAPPSNYWYIPGYHFTAQEAEAKCAEHNSTVASTNIVGANDIAGNNLWIWSKDDAGEFKQCREYNGALNCAAGSNVTAKSQAGCVGPYPSLARCTYTTSVNSNCYAIPSTPANPTGLAPQTEPPITGNNLPTPVGTVTNPPTTGPYWVIPGYNFDAKSAREKCLEYGALSATTETVGRKDIPGNNYWIWSRDTNNKNQLCREYNGRLNCADNPKLTSRAQAGCQGPRPSLPVCSTSGTNTSAPTCYIDVDNIV